MHRGPIRGVQSSILGRDVWAISCGPTASCAHGDCEQSISLCKDYVSQRAAHLPRLVARDEIDAPFPAHLPCAAALHPPIKLRAFLPRRSIRAHGRGSAPHWTHPRRALRVFRHRGALRILRVQPNAASGGDCGSGRRRCGGFHRHQSRRGHGYTGRLLHVGCGANRKPAGCLGGSRK